MKLFVIAISAQIDDFVVLFVLCNDMIKTIPVLAPDASFGALLVPWSLTIYFLYFLSSVFQILTYKINGLYM